MNSPLHDVIGPHHTVADLLARYPRTGRILLSHGMHCVGCAIAPFETLAEACLVYGMSLDRLLEELNVASSEEHEGKT